MILRVAVRTGGVLLVVVVVTQLLSWEPQPRDALKAAGPTLLIAAVPALWGRIDRGNLGSEAPKRIWAGVAGAVTTVLTVGMLLHDWPVLAVVFVAFIVGAAVLVPAWIGTGETGQTDASEDSSQLPVPRAVTTLVTAVGAAALLFPPIAAAGWAATIAWSGCFLDCQKPNRVAAAALAAAAVVLLADVIIWSIAAWRGFPHKLTTTAAVPLVMLAAFTYFIPS